MPRRGDIVSEAIKLKVISIKVSLNISPAIAIFYVLGPPPVKVVMYPTHNLQQLACWLTEQGKEALF